MFRLFLVIVSTSEPRTMGAQEHCAGRTMLPAGTRARTTAVRKISVEDAVAMIPNGASLMIGGFMGTGTPERLIDELVRQRKRDLIVIANDTAKSGVGVAKLISAKLVRKVIASHIGLNPETQQ